MPQWTTELISEAAAASAPVPCLSNDEAAARLDLSDLVTVFIISSGEPSFGECHHRIVNQTVKVRLEEICGVTPMWRAFQKMHEQAETPFFVQVDADMLLQPGAVADLLTMIQAAGETCAIWCEWLWGDAEERAITGVKIYRTDVVVNYPYTDSVSCDQDQFEAMQRDGFESGYGPAPKTQEECAGLHLSLQTPAMAFQRWRRLMEKYRARPEHMGWLTPYPERMRKRMVDDPSPMNLAIYEGVVAGMMTPLANSELDASMPDPTIKRLNWLMGQASDGPQEMTLYLTQRCNHRCTWCRLQQQEMESAGDMMADLVTRALSIYPTIRSVCLAGFGEPLLHRDLEGIFRVLKAHDCHTAMVTNGVRLAYFAQQLVDWGCDAVTVSLNAPDAERHEEITQESTWDLVMGGIEAAVPLLRTGVSAVVTRSTASNIQAFLALAIRLEVDHIHLHNLLPHGDPEDIEFLNEVIAVDSTDALETIEQAKSLPGADLVASWPVPIDLDQCPGTCESPFMSIGLDGDGRITPCRRVAPPSEEYGRLHQSSWVGPAFGKLRSAMLRDRPLPEMCRRCFGAWSQ